MSFDTGGGYGHPFAEDDIIKAQRWNSADGTLYRSILHVDSVVGPTQSYCSLLDGSPPTESYEYVRIGNSTQTDRQGSIYLTADDAGAPFIDVIDGVSS